MVAMGYKSKQILAVDVHLTLRLISKIIWVFFFFFFKKMLIIIKLQYPDEVIFVYVLRLTYGWKIIWHFAWSISYVIWYYWIKKKKICKLFISFIWFYDIFTFLKLCNKNFLIYIYFFDIYLWNILIKFLFHL